LIKELHDFMGVMVQARGKCDASIARSPITRSDRRSPITRSPMLFVRYQLIRIDN